MRPGSCRDEVDQGDWSFFFESLQEEPRKPLPRAQYHLRRVNHPSLLGGDGFRKETRAPRRATSGWRTVSGHFAGLRRLPDVGSGQGRAPWAGLQMCSVTLSLAFVLMIFLLSLGADDKFVEQRE